MEGPEGPVSLPPQGPTGTPRALPPTILTLSGPAQGLRVATLRSESLSWGGDTPTVSWLGSGRVAECTGTAPSQVLARIMFPTQERLGLLMAAR